jgi:hypothetical protein
LRDGASKNRLGPAREAEPVSGAEHVRKPYEQKGYKKGEEKADHGVSDETGAEFIHFVLLSQLSACLIK